MVKAETRMLALDEAEHLGLGNSASAGQAMQSIKQVSTDLRIPVVVAGCLEAVKVVATNNRSVESRFKPMVLDRWGNDENLQTFLYNLSMAMPLQGPSNLLEPTLVKELLGRTQGLAGEISAMVREAAILAITNGAERIGFKELHGTDYQGPIQRRETIDEFVRREEVYSKAAR